MVDEYGELMGLVTLEDILEEIIGKFTTSLPSAGPALAWDEHGTAAAEGTTPVREVNRALGLSLPTDGPKTLNGLILEHLQDIPEADVSIKIGNVPMEIVHAPGPDGQNRANLPPGRGCGKYRAVRGLGATFHALQKPPGGASCSARSREELQGAGMATAAAAAKGPRKLTFAWEGKDKAGKTHPRRDARRRRGRGQRDAAPPGHPRHQGQEAGASAAAARSRRRTSPSSRASSPR